MGALSQRASKWHRRALTKLGMDVDKVHDAVPENQPVELLAKSLFEAWQVSELNKELFKFLIFIYKNLIPGNLMETQKQLFLLLLKK